jgi:hypothetical protein
MPMPTHVEVVTKRRELADKEYWAIPRGRIIFRVSEGPKAP